MWNVNASTAMNWCRATGKTRRFSVSNTFIKCSTMKVNHPKSVVCEHCGQPRATPLARVAGGSAFVYAGIVRCGQMTGGNGEAWASQRETWPFEGREPVGVA